jgi:hypothetical protein
MKRICIVGALAVTIFLGGCTSVSLSLSLVQQAVLQLCSYEVSYRTVLELLAVWPGVGTVTEVANAICAAVTKPTLTARGYLLVPRPAPRLYGVPIRGQFRR